MERWAKAALQQIWVEADEELDAERSKQLAKHATRSESRSCIINTIFLARSEPSVVIERNQLDQNNDLLNLPNGTLDLETNELHRHKRNDYITRLCPTEYNDQIDVHKSKFYAFLQDITDNNIELMGYMQRAAGYALTGRICDHALFFLYGTGRNGKSTFLNTVINVLGQSYARIAPRDLLSAKRHGDSHPVATSTLHGYRFVATIEGEGNAKLAESLVKQLTGGDPIATRRMRENYWEFEPTHKIWLAANHKPRITGTDQGIWSRIRLIPFEVEIPEAKRDRSLLDKLRQQSEAEAVLAWLVAGHRAWREQGLDEPKIVREAISEYRREQDILGDWLDDRCEVGEDKVGRASDLFASYREWCEETKERFPLSQRLFGKALKDRGHEKQRDMRGIVYEGLRLIGDGGGILDELPV
jgi:putative DNA primase/helicase